MPEEKKKESFTFSDKIKNSKPIASKSFANRISSKIGSDGKPKKTLFERTKRDAPFFIAALVALLLLPFLYKYSGQVNEEAMITPGSEESVFDPERYGFDTVTEDPEGQIAQLAGRDPLSLIKGFGSDEPEEDSYDSQIYTDRSGMDDSFSSTDTSVEENNTNIYKQNAPAATRAAFRRAATKINPLSSAGLSSRSGGKLGVGMWGGSLKTAAQKVGAEGPRNSPKPVSLQPLQAAGKPSRSYFGQGAAAEARRSRDAMSKANAMQALMDAQMKPVEPGKIGGLSGGSFGPGGGNGDLKRMFAFNGKEPWWWDMMKRRAQMEWEADFNRKWDWIKWKDKLWQNVLGGIFNCVVMGTDDGAPGKFFGAKAGAGSPAECAGLDKEKWEAANPTVPFTKDNCRAFYGFGVNKDVQDPWSGGNSNEVTMGPIAQRLDCLSEGLGAAFGKWSKGLFGKNKGAFAEAGDCNDFAVNGVYTADFSSTKDGWTVMHYVVGVRTADLARYYDLPAEQQPDMLVVGYIGNGPTFNSNTSAIKERKDFVPLFIESVAIKGSKMSTKKSSSATNTGYKYAGYWRNGARSGGFEATSYDDAIAKCNAFKWPTRQDCRQEINMQAKDVDKVKKIAAVTDGGQMPTYGEFMAVLREGGAIRDTVSLGAKENLSKSTKGGKQGKDFVTGARCAYPLVRVSCDYFANVSNATIGEKFQGWPFAHLTFTNGMTGNNAYNTMKSRFFISYTLQGDDNSQPDAITTSRDTTAGQWYPVPHQNVRPYNSSWSKELSGNGFVTTNLGTERSNLPGAQQGGKNVASYQVVATSPDIKALQGANKRVIVTWEVRQCDNLLIDGSSITQGGCNRGNIVFRNQDGEVTKIAGQDKPGEVVSQVTCIYYDGYEPIGISTDVSQPEPAPQKLEPAPQVKAEPGMTDLYLAQKMSGTGGITNLYQQERSDVLQFPQFNIYGKGGIHALNVAFDNCLDVGYGPNQAKNTNPAQVFDQTEVQAYVGQVIAKANNQPQFQKAAKRFVHSGSVSVSELVDAMSIDYAMDPNAQVPLNVVCALGKTIGHNSFDRSKGAMSDKRAWRNMLGAFAAYIGPDSSYYPALYVQDAQGNTIIDRRFFGCLSATEGGRTTSQHTTEPQYHYGRYNWSQFQNGDLKQQTLKATGTSSGDSGRDPYLQRLQSGGWVENAWDPTSYPLYPIARATGFQRADSQDSQYLQKNYNGTIDDYNRNRFKAAYSNVLSDLIDSCHLQGSMPVANALKYVGGVCVNGKEAKPENGYGPNACTQQFRSSNERGTGTNLNK